MSQNAAKSPMPKPIMYAIPDFDHRYKYLSFNRFKRSLKEMRNNTFNDINDSNMLEQLDTRYNAPYPKKLKKDAPLSIEFDTSKKKDSSDSQPITDEFNLLQQPEISYDVPYPETLKPAYSPIGANDKKETNDIQSNMETQKYLSLLSLPVTEAIQFDVTNEDNDLPVERTTTYEDESFENQDILLIKYTDNIETDNTNTVTEPSEVVITSIKEKFTEMTPKINNIANVFTSTSEIKNKNKNITDIKAKEMSRENIVSLYLDELIHFKNEDIKKHPSKDDSEEVVVYIDNEFRSTTEPFIRDGNKNPVAWLKTLKYALNLIATKSLEAKADKLLQNVPYTENSNELKTDLEVYRVTESFLTKSSTVALDYKSTEDMFPIKLKVKRRTRDIKSIDFDIEKEIKNIQDKNNFTKRSQNKSSTSKTTVFSDCKESICPAKDIFSSEVNKNEGLNENPEFSKTNKAALANTNKSKRRIKRSAQSYTKTIKTDMGVSLITEKPEVTLHSTEIQNLTTNIPLQEGSSDLDLNAKKMNVGDLFQMVSEWFGTLAGVVQLNKTDPL